MVYITPMCGRRDLNFIALNDCEQKAEMCTKCPTIPAASVSKVVEVCRVVSLCMLYGIRYFLTEESQVRFAPEPLSVKKD